MSAPDHASFRGSHQHWIILLLCWPAWALGADEPTKSHRDELQRLLSLGIANASRDDIVSQMEVFIAGCPDAALDAKAMLHMASLFENSSSKLKIEAMPDRALAWYQRARDTALIGSPEWGFASLQLARRLVYHPEDRTANIAKARQLVEQVLPHLPDDVPLRYQVKQDLLVITCEERDLVAAEKLARELEAAARDPAVLALPPNQRQQVLITAENGPVLLLHTIVGAKLSPEETLERMEKLLKSHPDHVALKRVAEPWVSRLRRREEVLQSLNPPPSKPALTPMGIPRIWWLIVVTSMCGLGGLWFWRVRQS